MKPVFKGKNLNFHVLKLKDLAQPVVLGKRDQYTVNLLIENK